MLVRTFLIYTEVDMSISITCHPSTPTTRPTSPPGWSGISESGISSPSILIKTFLGVLLFSTCCVTSKFFTKLFPSVRVTVIDSVNAGVPAGFPKPEVNPVSRGVASVLIVNGNVVAHTESPPSPVLTFIVEAMPARRAEAERNRSEPLMLLNVT